MEYLTSQVNELKNQVKGLNDKSKKAPDDLKDQLKKFLDEAGEDVTNLQALMGKVEVLNEKTAEYFCEDAKKFKLEVLLSEILNFIRELTGAVKVYSDMEQTYNYTRL